jgi:hypothetical protein
MDRQSRAAFLALIVAQAAHSVEEYVFRLYDRVASRLQLRHHSLKTDHADGDFQTRDDVPDAPGLSLL